MSWFEFHPGIRPQGKSGVHRVYSQDDSRKYTWGSRKWGGTDEQRGGINRYWLWPASGAESFWDKSTRGKVMIFGNITPTPGAETEVFALRVRPPSPQLSACWEPPTTPASELREAQDTRAGHPQHLPGGLQAPCWKWSLARRFGVPIFRRSEC